MFRAFAQRAFDDAAQRRGAFGGEINVLHDSAGEFVEQFMQADEGRAAHVPVRLFGAGEQVEQFRHGAIQQGDGLFADGGRKRVASLIHK